MRSGDFDKDDLSRLRFCIPLAQLAKDIPLAPVNEVVDGPRFLEKLVAVVQ